MGVAGLWGMWIDPKTGERMPTYTMLTVNADDHALYRRFHRPEDEKRMPVILHPADFDAWLNCSVEAAPSFMNQFPAELLEAEPKPLAPRAKAKPRPLPEAGNLDAEPPLF
jgi:putative SOS response-associated peptidase YedK